MTGSIWIRRFSAHRNTVLIILTLGCYGLLTLGLKWWIYPGWTWKGFFSDIKSITTFAVFVSPFVIYVWKAYKGKSPQDSIVEALHRGVSLRFAVIGTTSLLIGIFALGAALAIFGERDPSPDLLDYVSESNWKYAQDVLNQLRNEPLRPDVRETLETYVGVHEASEKEKFKDSSEFHEFKSAALELLHKGQNIGTLNSLSFAEASKVIFLIEQAPDVLDAACQHLSSVLPTIRNRKQKVAVIAKLGELRLASKDYAGASKYFQDALGMPMPPSMRSVLTARVGNIQFVQGDIADAVRSYQDAEANYPEGRRFLYYSNFGYLLLQAKDYALAETEIKRAISVRKDDWISYLNLGLVYDATGQYSDSNKQYETVVDKADTELARREALILMGRSAELAGQTFETYIPLYLRAKDRVPSPAVLSELRTHPAELHALYQSMADGLRKGETHGIESYITWFETHQ
jgi:tetratricopeptide (TPR) repeat protein